MVGARWASSIGAAGRGGWPAALQQGPQGEKGPEGRVAPPARRKWRALARAARRQTHPPRAAPCLRRDAHARTLSLHAHRRRVRSNGREMAGTLVSCGGREAIPTRRRSSARHPKRGGAPSRRTGDGVGVADGRADGLADGGDASQVRGTRRNTRQLRREQGVAGPDSIKKHAHSREFAAGGSRRTDGPAHICAGTD